MPPKIEQKSEPQNSPRGHGERGPTERRPAEGGLPIPYLGALKVAVVVMGVMILAGVGTIVVTIVKRTTGGPADGITGPADPLPSAGPAQPSASQPAPFGDIEIELPSGSRVAATGVAGRRLAVEVHGPDGSVSILVLDLATGERLGSFVLRPAGPRAAPPTLQ